MILRFGETGQSRPRKDTPDNSGSSSLNKATCSDVVSTGGMKLTLGTYEHHCTEPVGMCGGRVISTINSVSLVRYDVALLNESGRPIGLGLPQLRTREGALKWADKHGHEVTNR